jgi:hypothetical protein
MPRFYLDDAAVDDEVRAAARSGRLTCPYPGGLRRRTTVE